ncbi:XRE family transcriptional regulator [Spongiactinospora rosea]|uniref:XRE family transcriptional regulator n=1 Tax=Spongiactinospora rosea TaxID=2248750 RepID=A0A366M545_9ACTN|nr:helix-turn-helix transcriptional regulator [Spongiactinospora rosea]RBQ20724.1 XRE family transcriptional regulator [Spongiactinospora rosea]
MAARGAVRAVRRRIAPAAVVSTPARQAIEALGERLKQIRIGAGLTGVGLAELAGWHSSKVSRFEYGRRTPTEDDLRIWCRCCDATDELPDLLAAVQSIETMYVEWRRSLKAGTRKRQRERVAMEAETRHFRMFETFYIPGLFQTPDYAASVMTSVVELHHLPDDVEQGIKARMERRHLLFTRGHRFHAVICEVALTAGVVPATVHVRQLDQLLGDVTLPNVRFGIIPTTATHHSLPLTGFWILDRRVVQIETLAASLALTQSHEITLYERAFDGLAASAVYGKAARDLISDARAGLG